MKKANQMFVFVAIVAAGLSSATLPMFAQNDQEQESSQSASIMNGQRVSPEQVVQRMSEKLNLTDDQKRQITPIIADRQEQLRALRADSSMRRMQKKREMKSIVEDSDKKIKAVLSKEQQRQYDELEKQTREQVKERRRDRNASN